ncbi:TIGR03943 family putative permease subunit [Compostimonas suwonensis]|uniref:TIGR03943 family putative permease subunit n=1 Tax=Compostimonas suwonensis TaxID=1048394 RepID=UPI001FE8FDBA|nr:TIGR03943 family protein [Compostimonas suwonensis]
MTWQGVVLTLVAVVITIVLAVNGQLGLYIHPRYFVFTIIMAVIGLAFVVGGLLHRGHDDSEKTSRRQLVLSVVGMLVLAVLTTAMIVVPPSTLTTATVEQRDINSGGISSEADTADAALLAGAGDFDRLTLKDWASLLTQTTDPSFFDGKTAKLSGFISPAPSDPEDIFYIARFVVTCCAVDAQPIGVPVYLEDWDDTFDADQWVEATGGFETNPSAASADPLVVVPTTLEPIDEPNDPYVY